MAASTAHSGSPAPAAAPAAAIRPTAAPGRKATLLTLNVKRPSKSEGGSGSGVVVASRREQPAAEPQQPRGVMAARKVSCAWALPRTANSLPKLYSTAFRINGDVL